MRSPSTHVFCRIHTVYVWYTGVHTPHRKDNIFNSSRNQKRATSLCRHPRVSSAKKHFGACTVEVIPGVIWGGRSSQALGINFISARAQEGATVGSAVPRAKDGASSDHGLRDVWVIPLYHGQVRITYVRSKGKYDDGGFGSTSRETTRSNGNQMLERLMGSAS